METAAVEKVNGHDESDVATADASLSSSLVTDSPHEPSRDMRNYACLERMQHLHSQDIIPILKTHWLFCEDIARIVVRGLRTGKNVLLWGPGGHGKSEMTDDILKIAGLYEDTFTLDFGDGTYEDSLWGGIDFKRLDTDRVLAYNPTRSFLNYPIAKFEELLDAPAPTINALKNTLTKRELHKDADPFPMVTRCIIATTNRNPEEYAKLSQSNDALVQRFPLRLKVSWPQYDEQTYRQLFEARGLGDATTRAAFATLMAKTISPTHQLSPRTVCHAFFTVLDSGIERANTTILKASDLEDLRFIPGITGVSGTNAEEFEQVMRDQKLHEFMEQARELVRGITDRLKHVKKMEASEVAEWRGTLDNTRTELLSVALTDDTLTKERTDMVSAIEVSIASLDEQARKMGRHIRWNPAS